eukprot:c22632_g1_i1 orf=331-747(-)
MLKLWRGIHRIKCCRASGVHISSGDNRPCCRSMPDRGAQSSGLESPYAFYPSVYLDTCPAIQSRLDKLEEVVTLLSKQNLRASKEAFSAASLEQLRSLEMELAETRKDLQVVLERQTQLYYCLKDYKDKRQETTKSCW